MTDSRSTAILVTDSGDGRAHYCDDSELQPLTGVRGVRVVCGQSISPAPLVVPIGPRCDDCVTAATRADVLVSSESPFLRCLRAAIRLRRD